MGEVLEDNLDAITETSTKRNRVDAQQMPHLHDYWDSLWTLPKNRPPCGASQASKRTTATKSVKKRTGVIIRRNRGQRL
jgi:hypothetical protein